MAVFGDPAGAAFCVWQPKEFSGAQLVKEPGTWNFGELNTPDPTGAEVFYGAVLGWEVSSFGADGADFTMFRMPGYGDHLAARDPELRDRLASDGAPEGFVDAVAWLIATDGDEFSAGAPPHWSITFAVDDAHAGRAGGRVGRRGGGAALRRAVRPDDGAGRPSGGEVHGEQVRAGGLRRS
jgi:uncharacterized protein